MRRDLKLVSVRRRRRLEGEEEKRRRRKGRVFLPPQHIEPTKAQRLIVSRIHIHQPCSLHFGPSRLEESGSCWRLAARGPERHRPAFGH